MIKLKGKPISTGDMPKFNWYADLIDFDGPLLSLFKGERNTDALYMWVDNDTRRNRWCIIPVNRITLNDYLQKKTSLKEVVLSAKKVIFFNMSEGVNGLTKRSCIEVARDDFPADYFPDEDAYLSDMIATPEAVRLRDEITENYMLGIDNELYTDDLSTIPYIFQQLYSFHYALEHLAVESVKNRVVCLLSSWTGGASAVNIFTGLRSLIPTIHRPQVNAIKYNSPGYIELNLLPKIAKSVEFSMDRSLANFRFYRMESFYNGTYKYLKENNISGFDYEGVDLKAIINDDTEKHLARRVSIFMKLLGWSQYQSTFDKLGAHPLQQLRTILAYYRRFKKLRYYVEHDNLSIGTSKIKD
ncbi:hypothetical protein [Pectobacterium jejuense]|uniref:Uncharacterized protein n=1 Tax=Pectobacterium jejuense TaxID=2974022 RepID=A0ABW8GVT1_9GAMM